MGLPLQALDEVTWLVHKTRYKKVKVNSSSNADHFQIFSEDSGAARASSIVRTPKCLEFPAKTLAALGI
jgi:hypothetical protein